MLSDRQRKTTNVQKQKYRGEYMCVGDGKKYPEREEKEREEIEAE